MHIIFFGDSLTQGTVGASYVERLAARLPGHCFTNEGVNGDTSLNLYRRVETDVIARRPDGVFIMIGVNDAISNSEPASRLYYRFVKRVPGGRVAPLAFRENLRAVLARLLAAGITPWVALPPVERCPAAVAALRQINAAAAEVCAELRVPALDLLAALTPPHVPERPAVGWSDYWRVGLIRVGVRAYDRWRRQGGYTYTFDGVHLTAAGAEQVAERVAAFLRDHGVR